MDFFLISSEEALRGLCRPRQAAPARCRLLVGYKGVASSALVRAHAGAAIGQEELASWWHASQWELVLCTRGAGLYSGAEYCKHAIQLHGSAGGLEGGRLPLNDWGDT